MMQPDTLTQFALLVRRLAAADYDLDISGDFDIPESQAGLLDSLAPIPGSEATGVVSADSAWDGVLVCTVRLNDLGYRYWQLQGIAEKIKASPGDQVLLVEALLLHQTPFIRWVTILDPEVWSAAVASGSHEEVDVAITDEAIDFRFHASRVSSAFQAQMERAAAEGES